jgi:hypothetical protein
MAKAELPNRVKNTNLEEPRLGAFETLTRAPQSSWDATWVE